MEIVPLAVFTLGIAALAMSWAQVRARRILEGWARKNGYRILSSRVCWFWPGPFFLRRSARQWVFRVTVADGSGQTRRGWVACGGFWAGLYSKRADVLWDK